MGPTDDAFTEALRVNLQRLIVYAKSADTSLQREVAEKLANEAVKRASSFRVAERTVRSHARVCANNTCLLCVTVADRQVQIVELEGLKLLLPLTQSKDTEVQRLAAHALANLSVNCACLAFAVELFWMCRDGWLDWGLLLKTLMFTSGQPVAHGD